MAPLLPTLARRAHSILAGLSARDPDGGGLAALGPLRAHAVLSARDEDYNGADPSTGVVDPHHINNKGMFALFAIIGVAFVVAGIWFFFWAKNGGIHFRENDWDDYKSTVLRRKGPNGTLLSGATPSTQLGGGSVYKDVDDGTTTTDDVTTVVSGTTGITGITGGVSDIVGRERRRKKREQKERERERRREEKVREKEEKRRQKSSSRRKVGEDGVLVDEQAEAEAEAQLRDYRHEKPARVGGLNREADGSQWDGSTNPAQSTAAGSSTVTGTESAVTSELISNRERTPTTTPTKRDNHRGAGGAGGGIRKVYSTADKNAHREARRMREESRAGHRRDFSFQRVEEGRRLEDPGGGAGGGDGRAEHRHRRHTSRPPRDEDDRQTQVSGSAWTESEVSGSGAGAGEEDRGTKAYRHVIPGLSSEASGGSAASDYQEEKRKRRAGAGYRRGRHDAASEDGR